MYIYFRYAHKPSWYSVDDAPYVEHEAQLHMVLEPWDEAEATSVYRLTGEEWNTEYLAVDGTDADATVIGSNTMRIGQPARLMAFEVLYHVSSEDDGLVEWDPFKQQNTCPVVIAVIVTSAGSDDCDIIFIYTSAIICCIETRRMCCANVLVI